MLLIHNSTKLEETVNCRKAVFMKSLQNLTVKVLNIDIVKYQDGTEFLKLQGIVPMSEYRKNQFLLANTKYLICLISIAMSTIISVL